jgi:hypothetical protein
MSVLAPEAAFDSEVTALVISQGARASPGWALPHHDLALVLSSTLRL